MGFPALSSTKPVILEIIDMNDNSSFFRHVVYNTQIMDNNSPGVSLLQGQTGIALELRSLGHEEVKYYKM